MGAFMDRIKGVFNRGMGRMKQDVGRDTGNDRLAGEGYGDELKGTAQSGLGRVKKDVGNLAHDIGAKIKRS